MTLTNRAIGRKIYEALRDNAAILARCEELFDGPHAVFYGFSGQQSPPTEQLPAFEIMPWAKSRAEIEDDRSFEFTLDVAINTTEKTEELMSSGIIRSQYLAVDYLEELLDLAMTAIKAALPELIVAEERYEYDPIEFYPLYVGMVALTLTFPNLGGGFEPSL